MTIADNLQALANQKLGYQDSVEACKTSLINKDVAVTVSAKLADIAGLIDEITIDRSWENYVAVRNRTKTTIEDGDIDCSKITGANSARNLFSYLPTLTKAVLDFRLINGSFCLTQLFSDDTLLNYVSLNLSTITGNNFGGSIFVGCTNINTLILTGISDVNAVWGSTSIANNLFAATQLGNCKNLSFTVPILPNLYLAVMTSLNLASVVQVLGQLNDYSGGTAHTITFNRAFTGLSQGDYDTIAAAVTTANARNWTVAGLTYSM